MDNAETQVVPFVPILEKPQSVPVAQPEAPLNSSPVEPAAEAEATEDEEVARILRAPTLTWGYDLEEEELPEVKEPPEANGLAEVEEPEKAHEAAEVALEEAPADADAGGSSDFEALNHKAEKHYKRLSTRQVYVSRVTQFGGGKVDEDPSGDDQLDAEQAKKTEASEKVPKAKGKAKAKATKAKAKARAESKELEEEQESEDSKPQAKANAKSSEDTKPEAETSAKSAGRKRKEKDAAETSSSTKKKKTEKSPETHAELEQSSKKRKGKGGEGEVEKPSKSRASKGKGEAVSFARRNPPDGERAHAEWSSIRDAFRAKLSHLRPQTQHEDWS